jgi:hypothetical protein
VCSSLLDLVCGWSDGLHSQGVPIAPLGLGVWVVRRVHSQGAPTAPSWTWVGRRGGGPGGQATVSHGRAAIERVGHQAEEGWVHGERTGHHAGALDH